MAVAGQEQVVAVAGQEWRVTIGNSDWLASWDVRGQQQYASMKRN